MRRKSVQPDAVPVGFDFDGNYFYVGGMNLLKSTKYKNVPRNNMVAIVIDDLKTIDPWNPRVVKIYGIADIVTPEVSTKLRTLSLVQYSSPASNL